MAEMGFVTVEGSKYLRNGDIFGYWELRVGDTAKPLIVPRYSDKSIHMFGTWGGGSIAMVGGNDPLLSQFDEVYDFEGTTIVQSAARKAWTLLPNVFAIKPVLTGGNGTTVVRVAIVGRGGL